MLAKGERLIAMQCYLANATVLGVITGLVRSMIDDLQVGAAQVKRQKGAVGLSEHAHSCKMIVIYPVSEPSGTSLTNVGLRTVKASLIDSDGKDVHHGHGATILSESLGGLTEESLCEVYEGVLG